MKAFFKKLKGFLKQGTSPKALALSTTLGILMGLFPVLGITTWTIPIIASVFRLNVALMLSLSYLVWPIQILLIIPFLRFGEWFWEVPAFPISLEQIQIAFEASFFGAISDLWNANVCAAWGWLVAGIPIGVLLYFLLVRIFDYLEFWRIKRHQT